jgi:hypothetical protein
MAEPKKWVQDIRQSPAGSFMSRLKYVKDDWAGGTWGETAERIEPAS